MNENWKNSIIYNVCEAKVLNLVEQLKLTKDSVYCDKDDDVIENLEFVNNNSLLVFCYEYINQVTDLHYYLTIIIEKERILFLKVNCIEYFIEDEFILEGQVLNEYIY